MEKKIRVKRLNHQDDVKRSWKTACPLTEDFESLLLEESDQTQSQLNFVEDNSPERPPSSSRHDADISPK